MSASASLRSSSPPVATTSAGIEPHDGRGDPAHFGRRVADIDDRDAGIVAQPHQIGQDFALVPGVERSERLVEQKESRPHQAAHGRRRRAGARRRTIFPAGDRAGGRYREAWRCARIRPSSSRDAAHAAAVIEILPHREMRKQPAFLEHITDAAAMRRHVDAGAGIEQHGLVERNRAAIGRHQTGDHIDDRSLAGARRTEQSGRATRGFELYAELEHAELLFHIDREHDQSPWKRMAARRLSHSEANKAAKASTIEIKTNRPAAASPPGTCVKV